MYINTKWSPPIKNKLINTQWNSSLAISFVPDTVCPGACFPWMRHICLPSLVGWLTGPFIIVSGAQREPSGVGEGNKPTGPPQQWWKCPAAGMKPGRGAEGMMKRVASRLPDLTAVRPHPPHAHPHLSSWPSCHRKPVEVFLSVETKPGVQRAELQCGPEAIQHEIRSKDRTQGRFPLCRKHPQNKQMKHNHHKPF